MYIQSDLSYPASLYPDLSIIRTRSRQDFFFVCTIITGKRTTTLLIAKKECRVRCYNTLHVATCTPLGRQLHVLNIESPISGQIPYPDERRSRHGRIREVRRTACMHTYIKIQPKFDFRGCRSKLHGNSSLNIRKLN